MKNNKTSIAIVLFLIFAMTIPLIAIPAATAQEYDLTKTTYAFIGAVPNPVGVGQEALLHVGITDDLGRVADGWEGLTVTVQRPDGTTETLGPFRTDSTGGTGAIYIPTMVGNYTLQTHFPQQTYTWTTFPYNHPSLYGLTVLYRASTSEKLTLVVQEDPLDYYPGVPLPTEYWTRPIDGQLREWNVIAGSYLQGSIRGGAGGWYHAQVVPYNEDAPETAHILWTKPLELGGLAGGAHGPHAIEEGDAYQGKFLNTVVVAGILVYNEYSRSNFWPPPEVYEQRVSAVDLRTGEQLWSKVLGDNERVAFAQMMYWDAFNMHGVFSYIWTTIGSTWNAYDPLTGRYIYTMTNVPAGPRTYGPKGEILITQVDRNEGWMALWNSTNIPELYGRQVHPTDPDYGVDFWDFVWGTWEPWGKTVDARGPVKVSPDQPLGLAGYSWNVTIPKGLPGSINAVFQDRIIGSTAVAFGATDTLGDLRIVLWGISTAPGREGTLLFNTTWRPGLQDLTAKFGSASLEDGVFTLWVEELRQHFGFSIDTGQFLWKTEEPEHYLQRYYYATRIIADGKLYSTGMSGTLYVYDVKTGNLLWTYDACDPYSEILWGNNWPIRIELFTDGKLYLAHCEHSPIDPKPRGAPFICLNADTGEEVWRADGLIRAVGWGGASVIGDSIIATIDAYDNRIYAIGKGPSQMKVSIQNDITKHGSNVLVSGLVTDISPGTDDISLQKRFPHGVPAVADEIMSEWMLYVYKQFPRPADFVGVEVVVSVLDPNNNCYEVGRTTTDASGGFKLMFEPEVPGEYTITATFDGSKSYWPSNAHTYLGVEEAPAIAEPTPPPASLADVYLLPGIIGIIIAIAIVGAVIVLMLRKR